MTAAQASEARTLSYLDAIREAMEEELERDERVFLIGEDLHSNIYGSSGGLERFGESRIRDTPISEAGIVGAGIGAAIVGMRPIVDLTIASFVYCAMDQLVSQAAKTRYMYGGQASVPLVVRAALYYGRSNAAHHSDRPHPMLMNVPGLKIITPATPADVKGMLKSAIRDDDPVICFEDINLWLPRLKGPVPEDGDFLIPLGLADVKRVGGDVTVVAISGALPQALAAAESLSEQGISVEVVDPRTLAPMDWTTILGSVAKTGRLVVADPANRTCSAASEIVATAFEELGGQLRAVRRVTCPDVPIPYSPVLERGLYPTSERIGAAVRSLAG
jgi:acetoin:2,6-dichlorophenolindophenol oxidoreductase subunit beta